MDAYIYQADLFCTECTEKYKREIAERSPASVPANPADEHTYDSCGRCGLFLENPLTTDGYNYLRDLIARNSDSPTVQEWAEFYSCSAEQI